MTIFGKGPIQQASISAVVIRADGTTEELGVIAYYNRNPLKQINFNIRRWLKKWRHS
jgi:hypothetical protein